LALARHDTAVLNRHSYTTTPGYGGAIPLANIADAIRLMQQFMPTADDIGAVVIRDTRGASETVVQRGGHLAFGFGGNGVLGLAEGWGEPEDWGTWSVSKRARIRLSVGKAGRDPLHADLRYRAFVHQRHPRLDIASESKGKRSPRGAALLPLHPVPGA
jgi:hypothetical protein